MRLDPPREPNGEPLRQPDAENDSLHINNLEVLEDSFVESGNPAHAIDAIVYAYDAGLVPPTWTMDWLAPRLRELMDSEGKGDIAKLLGLNAPGRGKAQPIPALFARSKRNNLAWLLHILHTGFDVTISDAATCVWAREYGEESDPDCKHAGWLAEEYSRRWKKQFEGAESGLDLKEWYSSAERRAQFLATFPASVLPPGLK